MLVHASLFCDSVLSCVRELWRPPYFEALCHYCGGEVGGRERMARCVGLLSYMVERGFLCPEEFVATPFYPVRGLAAAYSLSTKRTPEVWKELCAPWPPFDALMPAGIALSVFERALITSGFEWLPMCDSRNPMESVARARVPEFPMGDVVAVLGRAEPVLSASLRTIRRVFLERGVWSGGANHVLERSFVLLYVEVMVSVLRFYSEPELDAIDWLGLEGLREGMLAYRLELLDGRLH